MALARVRTQKAVEPIDHDGVISQHMAAEREPRNSKSKIEEAGASSLGIIAKVVRDDKASDNTRGGRLGEMNPRKMKHETCSATRRDPRMRRGLTEVLTESRNIPRNRN